MSSRQEAAILATLQDLGYFHDLRQARDASDQLPGPIEYTREERAEHFRTKLAEASDGGRRMAGPYVQSVLGWDVPPDLTASNTLVHTNPKHLRDFMDADAAIRSALHHRAPVQRAFLGRQHQFNLMLQHGAAEGWITPFTNAQGDNVHMEAIVGATLSIGDIISTYADGVEGYYDSVAKQLVVAPGVGATIEQRIVDTQDRIERVLPRALGGIYGRGTAEWMRSAFGAHLQQVMQEGEPLLFAPSVRGERTSPFAVYQRELLGSLLAYENVDLTREFMLAMTSKDPNSNEWHTFREAFDKLWGIENAFELLTSYMQRQIDDAGRQHPDATFMVHREIAAKETLDVLRENPKWIFKDPERTKPAVGALALRSKNQIGGKHRPGKHRAIRK